MEAEERVGGGEAHGAQGRRHALDCGDAGACLGTGRAPWSAVPGAPLVAQETSCPRRCRFDVLPGAAALGEPLAAEGHSLARRKPAPGAAVTASAGRPASIHPSRSAVSEGESARLCAG